MERLEDVVHALCSTLDRAKKAEYVLLYENVYAWTIENLGECEAKQLNEALLKDAGYLGCVRVDLENGLHKFFYLDLLVKRYILKDGCISMCVSEANQDEYVEELDFLRNCGFEQAKLLGDYDGYQ
ncbi:MAG: hypothetical protein NC347_11800 [Clostridium sp.]|nr:hypothetical protein [Clostridium sp.]